MNQSVEMGSQGEAASSARHERTRACVSEGTKAPTKSWVSSETLPSQALTKERTR
jgi:hypothetical protein